MLERQFPVIAEEKVLAATPLGTRRSGKSTGSCVQGEGAE